MPLQSTYPHPITTHSASLHTRTPFPMSHLSITFIPHPPFQCYLNPEVPSCHAHSSNTPSCKDPQPTPLYPVYHYPYPPSPHSTPHQPIAHHPTFLHSIILHFPFQCLILAASSNDPQPFILRHLIPLPLLISHHSPLFQTQCHLILRPRSTHVSSSLHAPSPHTLIPYPSSYTPSSHITPA